MTTNKSIRVSFPASEKIYVNGSINKVRVGMRRITLDDTGATDTEGRVSYKPNTPLIVYDTSGAYSDPKNTSLLQTGLPRIREEWSKRRKDIVSITSPDSGKHESANKPLFPIIIPSYKAKEGKHITQLSYAKRRIITPEMEYVAIRESQHVEALGLKSYITPDFVRKEIAAGRAVIPANINHPELEPMIIGNKFLVKVNVPFYSPSVSSGIEEELEKMIRNCKWGADSFLDLSKSGDIPTAQNWYLRNAPVPIGSIPLYEALQQAGNEVAALNWDIYRNTLIEQAERGIDFVMIHAALLQSHIDKTIPRLTGIDSPAGLFMAEWIRRHQKENFLYTHFEEICDILRQYDVTLVIGNSLGAGSIYDAGDSAYYAELKIKGKLTDIARENLVQTMIEGPGCLPMNKIGDDMKEQQYACRQAPYFMQGPVTTDISYGYDHIASAIGAAQIASFGASLIGCVLPSQSDHSSISKEEYRTAIHTHKIAAHAADVAKGHPGAQARDNALSKARIEQRHKDFCHLAIDPEKALLLYKNKIKGKE
ncbi:phosphomethylpyrimidine synthase ThiC [Parabacteroides sp. OttesenSCG-928-J18]|nr:phosphomethylpyrimidine synthase ThiC [Parabacteroides sp. OttesenSCG-928-J18]